MKILLVEDDFALAMGTTAKWASKMKPINAVRMN